MINLDQTTIIDNNSLQLIFPIKKAFFLGSPLGMFAAVYYEENFVRSKLPTCDDFYNLFHPSDLIAYRIEPLLKRYEYPDNQRTDCLRGRDQGSFFENARDVSHQNIDQSEYLYGE